MTDSILILHCDIVKDGSLPARNGYVLIENGKITDSGSMLEMPAVTAERTINAQGKLLIPGLINAHNHSPMTLFRGLADDLELNDWLHNHVFPAEAAHVNEHMVYWCAKLAAAEMVLSGTCCVADGYFHADQIARAFSQTGLRGVVAQGVVDFPAPGVPDPAKNIEEVARFIKKWQNLSPLITPAVFAHSPYTCSPKTLRNAKDLADSSNVRFFIHVAESPLEKDMLLSPTGKTPLQHLHNLGILDENCVLIHAIWLDDEDLDILCQSQAHVVSCPQSNYKLASGKLNVNALLEKGIPVGLGTDGSASNNSLDMFREMDIFAKSHKAFQHDPTILPAEEVFSAATVNNNRILGCETSVTIAPGSRADLVLIDCLAPHLTPMYNKDLLVYAVKGSDVDSVIINGQLVVENRQIQTISLEETKDEVRNLATLLRQEYPGSV